MNKKWIMVWLWVVLVQCYLVFPADRDSDCLLAELSQQAFVGTQQFSALHDDEWISQCLNLGLDQKKWVAELLPIGSNGFQGVGLHGLCLEPMICIKKKGNRFVAIGLVLMIMILRCCI